MVFRPPGLGKGLCPHPQQGACAYHFSVPLLSVEVNGACLGICELRSHFVRTDGHFVGESFIGLYKLRIDNSKSGIQSLCNSLGVCCSQSLVHRSGHQNGSLGDCTAWNGSYPWFAVWKLAHLVRAKTVGAQRVLS